jgi:hypothetical protein
MRRSAVIFKGRGSKLEVGRTAYWSGLLALAQEEPERALEELEKAQQIFEQLGAAADLDTASQQIAAVVESLSS